ncbi:MAG: transcriptional regulator [Bacteroidales bacterium]|nr:MAG: transcriptional regulator [Bacteroidales bacterium]
MPINVKLDILMVQKRISSTELSKKLGITMANLSILKNNKARAIRFSTLEMLCNILDCKPGDLLEYTDKSDSMENP